MSEKWKTCLLLILAITLLSQKEITAQDIHIKIGFRDSIKSEILQETRHVLIHLPDDYFSSDKSYPVLFQLDGGEDVLFETTAIANRLALREEIIPELIIVAIANTNQSRDMWPTNTKYYPKPNVAGAKDFLDFLEEELIPFIEKKYRTSGDKILYGQSLSGVFTMYALLESPKSFTSFIACSGAFPGCEEYFLELSLKAFQQKDQFSGQKVFVTNGLKDELDPDGKMDQTMIEFSNSINNNLGDKISYEYVTYQNDGHVPFQSLYHGLKFVFESDYEN
jgi:predicted alpha/beta superfamily hydrolase